MLKLRLLTGPRAGRQLRVSDTKPVSVGRRVGRLRLHDSRVSKNHAKVFFTGGVWVLRDLGSANGTFVNHKPCDGLVELETGDLIQMGRVLIKVLQADAVGMDPMRGVPGATRPKVEPKSDTLGIDAFTASGATGVRPAIDPGAPVSAGGSDDDIDLASIFGESGSGDEDDLIDFSDQTRIDASRAGIDPGLTQTNDDTLSNTPAALTEARDAKTEVPDPDDADDPLLADAADTVGSEDDLVRIEDEATDPATPGTTMLAALEAEDAKPEVVGLRLDQRADQPEVVGQQEDTEADDPTPTEDEIALVAEADEDEDVDPGSPVEIEAIGDSEIGLIDADAATETSDGTEAEPEPLEAEAEGKVEVETEVEPEEAELVSASVLAPDDSGQPDEPPSDAEAAAPAAPADPAGAAASRAADASLTDTDETDTQGIDLDAVHAELSFADVLDRTDEPIDTEALAAELWPTEAEAADEPDPAPPVAEPQAGHTPAVESTAEAEPELESASARSDEDTFDIDAAFDALSAGLDDSVQLPAITDDAPAELHAEVAAEHDDSLTDADDTRDPEPIAQDTQPAEPETEPEPAELRNEEVDTATLAGSQVDLAFIREALARLGDEQPDAPAEPDAEDRLTGSTDSVKDAPPNQADNAVTLKDEMIETTPTDPGPEAGVAITNGHANTAVLTPAHATTHQPPPGINPTSVLPPTEPEFSYRSHGTRRNRWIYTGLALLVVLGLGAAFAITVINNPASITGRDDTTGTDAPDPATSDTETTTPEAPADNETSTTPNTASGDDDSQSNTARPIAPTTPTRAEPLAGSPPIPDPFAEGPRVLGRSATAGLTATPDPNAALATPERSNIRPGVVINPGLPGDNTPRPAVPQDPGSNNNGGSDNATNPGNAGPTTPLPTDPNPNTAAPVEIGPARIVFLVDASGSLVDSLPQMLVWLGEAIDTVGRDERFTIIFFKANRAIEARPAGLKAPTDTVRAALDRDWLDPAVSPVLPTGRSDPSTAIELALRYNPTDLYVLSDESFARYAGDTTREQAVKLIDEALGDARVRVHGVQFFYKDEGGVLETLANRYDGTFEFVKEAVVPDTNPIDLLEELGRNE